MSLKRRAQAVWTGTGADGSGHLTVPSGVLQEQPYSFKARFKDTKGTSGTNPEELIAAAHAGCFSMALSFQLTGAGHPPEEISTDVTLTMEKEDEGWTIVGVHLDVLARVPGIDQLVFLDLASKAKSGCPVSRALKADVSMTARLA